ncbi:hypothetical protein BGZ83_011228 [Gryganskiella cystojenkinii]|nr:hypothetical protein BGZ83_011228 [Gryganskiella cystojenkinii]
MLQLPSTSLPLSRSFLSSSLNKAMDPFTTTAPTEILLRTLSSAVASVFLTFPPSKMARVPLCDAESTGSRSHHRRRSGFAHLPLTSLWTSITLLFFLSVALVPLAIDAAPAKKNDNRIKVMDVSMSATSALPLQLQIEAQAEGTQKLAFLPSTGPGLDFYYLNYRPSYLAGKSKIDFWMLTPKGSKPPKTASLELMDEFGKIRLATLVPEGTAVPANLANKNEPFLWKSWAIPKELNADFNFSEKFRVVLKTSDSKQVSSLTESPKVLYATQVNKDKNKRQKNEPLRFELLEFLVRGKNKHVNALDNAKTVKPSTSTPATAGLANGDGYVVQDRQFRIKGLTASPGGKANPAKMYINSVAPPSALLNNSPTTGSQSSDKNAKSGLDNNNNHSKNLSGESKSAHSVSDRLQSQKGLRYFVGSLVVLYSVLQCAGF